MANPSQLPLRDNRNLGETRSRSAIAAPKLSLWRRMQIPFIAGLVSEVMRAIGPTLRLEVIGVHNAIQIRRSGEPGIGAFWHRCIFPAAWIWRNRGIVVLNTVNFDGQWTRRVIERLGFGTAQGSSSRGGVEGLAALAQELEAGKHVAFTIDGPRGPRYVAKPGPVILARRTGRPISVFHIAVQDGITFKRSWDLFRLPWLYSRVVMFVAPPIYVPTDADADGMKQKQTEMQAALERVRDAAESWFTRSEAEQDRIREEWSDGSHRRRREAAASRGELPAYVPEIEEESPPQPEAEAEEHEAIDAEPDTTAAHGEESDPH